MIEKQKENLRSLLNLEGKELKSKFNMSRLSKTIHDTISNLRVSDDTPDNISDDTSYAIADIIYCHAIDDNDISYIREVATRDFRALKDYNTATIDAILLKVEGYYDISGAFK